MKRGTRRPGAITGLLLACGSFTAAADGGNTQSEKSLASANSTAQVLHRSVRIDASFERFTSALQKILGHFPADIQQDIIERPQLAVERLKAAEGAAMERGFQTRDAELELGRVLGELADSRMP